MGAILSRHTLKVFVTVVTCLLGTLLIAGRVDVVKAELFSLLTAPA